MLNSSHNFFSIGGGLFAVMALTSCSYSQHSVEQQETVEQNKKSYSVQQSQGKALERRIVHDGIERSYIVYLPSGYQPQDSPAVVFSLHGRTGTSQEAMQSQRWEPLADSKNFIVVFPQALATSKEGKPVTQWNALNVNSGVDDVGFLTQVAQQISGQYGANAKRAYVVGFSNGGMMVSRLVCEAGETFAAMASVAGIGSTAHTDCAPQTVTPIMFIHGEKDHLPPQQGRASNLRPVEATINVFVDAYACSKTPEVKVLEDKLPTDGTQTTHYRYSKCEDDASVEYYFIQDGGHTWPGNKPNERLGNTSQDFKATEALWQFFDSYERK